MGRINLLSSKIYNRIAAGEVVERPASAVKELVENSIDAGAKNITVEIENGGITSICVTDNGSGIENSDLKKALLPHATSKISTLKDLDNITSLGFRGEALASIAAVSKIKIVSKPVSQPFGAEIISNGGEIGDVGDCAASEGTVITVNNLFYNTPVRAKFLKSERSEENEVSTTMARFILGHPDISFKYITDGKTALQSYGDGMESSMVCVYGPGIIGDCFKIQTEKNGIQIEGYLGKQYFSKPNRSYQTVFLNGRFVQNQTISSAIGNAYASYLMKRQYPFYVLNINMPADAVDVNVHPNKIDVRFANNQIVYGAVYSVVSKVLDGSSEILNIIRQDENLKAAQSLHKNENNHENINNNANDYVRHISKNDYKFDTLRFSDSKIIIGAQSDANFKDKKDDKNSADIFAENKAYIEKLEKERKERELKNKISQQISIEVPKDLKYVGQVLNTYLIFEDGSDIYFVDQHAAHERLLFDMFNNQIEKNSIATQPLIIPYILEVNNKEFSFLTEKNDILNSIGIEIEEFGKNAFKISSLPVYFAQMNIKDFFDDILSQLDTLKQITIKELLLDKLAQAACKAAIKSGDRLFDEDIKTIAEKLKDNPGLKCPHGRPCCIKITRTEIDKWFKRII